MARVENPFLTYYSPFSPTARRKVALRVFTIANIAVLASVSWALLRDATSSEVVYFMWFLLLFYLSVMPQFCFFFFAPRNHTPENLEELLLTGMSRRSATWGYCQGPVYLGAFLVGACLLAECSAMVRVAEQIFGRRGGTSYLILPLLLGLLGSGIIAISTGARSWMRHPESVLRAFLLTPVAILLQFLLCLAMSALFIWVAEQAIPQQWEDVGYMVAFCIPPIVGALFSLRLTWRLMDVLLFREVDPEAYRRAYWLGGRKIRRGEEDARADAHKRLLSLHASSWKEIAGALLLTLLFWGAGGWAGRLLHTPEHGAWNRAAYNPTASIDPDADALTGLLKGLFGFQNLYALPLFLTTMIVLLVARRRTDRLFPLLEGGVLGCLQVAVVPTLCFSALQLAVTGVVKTMEPYTNWSETILVSVLFLPGVFALTWTAALLVAPRKRRMAWVALLLAAAIVIEFTPLIFMYHSSRLDDIVLLNMSKWGVAVPLAILSLSAWLLAYGMDLCGQRLHRLETRHLPRFGFNIDQTEEAQSPPREPASPAP